MRTRNFATVVYPESAPPDWQAALGELCIPSFVSPLHEYDIDREGVIKKEHYHVMLMFDGVKAVSQVQEIISRFGGVGCEVVHHKVSYARYLCHLDEKDKYPYSPDDVLSFGGANYAMTIIESEGNYKAIGDLIRWCVDTQTYNYADVVLWCIGNRPDWFKAICGNGSKILSEFLYHYRKE